MCETTSSPATVLWPPTDLVHVRGDHQLLGLFALARLLYGDQVAQCIHPHLVGQGRKLPPHDLAQPILPAGCSPATVLWPHPALSHSSLSSFT